MRIQVGLKNFATTVVLSTLFLSCTVSSQKNSEQAVAQNSEPKIDYGNLIFQDPSDYIMIPVELPRNKNDKRLDTISYNSRYFFYTNIIFYNPNSGESHLLLNKQALIEPKLEFIELKKEKDKPVQKVLLLTLIENDTNGNNQLDENDATIGYLTDLSGKKLQQITPLNTRLLSWNFDKKRGIIFLSIQKDSDNDKKFNERDERTYIRVNINKPSIGTDIINDKVQQKLKSLSFK